MKKEFMFAFQITRKIIFEVQYYTLGGNNHPYFATCCNKFNQPKTDWCQCGQAQRLLLDNNDIAMKFFEKWDHCHCKDLTEKERLEVLQDLEILKREYNYICLESNNFSEEHLSHIPFWKLKDFSMQPVKKIKAV